jgi:hypothetical protein
LEATLAVPEVAGGLQEVAAIVAAGDHTWVVDPVRGLVLEFDSMGRFSRSAGGKGRAVGQYDWPIGAGSVNGNVWIWDQQTSRISVLGPDLQVRDTIPARPGYVTALSVNGGTIAYPAFLRRRTVPLFRGDRAGTLLDTLAMLVKGNGWMSAEAGGQAFRIRQPFQGSHLWSPSPVGEGVVVADLTQAALRSRGSVRVTRIGPRGDTLFEVDAIMAIDRMTDAVVDSAARALAHRLARGVDTFVVDEASLAARVGASIERFESVPPIQEVHLDADGRTWLDVRRRPPGARWLVLDSGGNRLHRVEYDGNGSFRAATGSRVWLVETDREGARIVQQYTFG